MKFLTCFVFVITVLFSVMSKAKSESGSACGPGEPVIEYSEAITIAKKSQARYFPTDGSFIDLVKLDCKNKKHIWVVGFRRKEYESGHLLIYVYMDGSTKTSVVKDG